MVEEPIVFEVGPLTLAFTETPVSGRFLDYVTQAVQGDIEAVIPNPAMVGTYHQLRGIYNYTRTDAENITTNLLDASRIDWYGRISTSNVSEGLRYAKKHSIEGWDGYFVEVTLETGGTLFTIDTGIDDIDSVPTLNIMDSYDYHRLDRYLEEEGLIG